MLELFNLFLEGFDALAEFFAVYTISFFGIHCLRFFAAFAIFTFLSAFAIFTVLTIFAIFTVFAIFAVLTIFAVCFGDWSGFSFGCG